VWLKYTVPAPGEPGGETWKGANNAWQTGGAAIWVTGTYDPDTNQTIWGTGNPVPMFDPTYRPGDNLYTNSAISWDPDTGRMNWYFQYTPGDQWDFDEAGTHILIDAEVAGQPRKLIAHSARNGFVYTMNRNSGVNGYSRIGLDVLGRVVVERLAKPRPHALLDHGAKRLLRQSGYSGQPVTLMAAQDIPENKAWGDVTVDLLNRLGMKVDFVATDWGTVVARRAQRSGWHAYLTGHPGVDCANPATNKAARANGDQALFGWPSNREVEAQVSAWFDAKTLDEEKTIVRRLNRAALDYVVYAPLGWYLVHQAWRKNVTGIVPGPLPFFWGVTKTV
jgi:hypothetical protein